MIGAVVGFVLGLVLKVAIAALVVGGVVYAVKRARSHRPVSGKKAEREVRDRESDRREYNMPLPRADVEPVRDEPVRGPAKLDVEDDLARLKREMGS